MTQVEACLGAFIKGGAYQYVPSGYSSSTTASKDFAMNASNSNALYADDVTTVQPPSYQALIIIKD